jgi:hypothetical protein
MSTFVRDTGDSTPSSEAPIAWRIWWKPENGRPFGREFQAAARHKDFQTRTEAEVEKRRIDERLAGQGIVHIAPIYISRGEAGAAADWAAEFSDQCRGRPGP